MVTCFATFRNSPNGRMRRVRDSDASAQYLFLIIGIPVVAFLIAASAAFEAHGLSIPLVRIGTGVAGLMLQATPFMLLGALMSAAVATFIPDDYLARHAPKSLIGGLTTALVAGLCLPVCDCMVVPTFANLIRKRLAVPVAVTFMAAVPVMNPMAIWSTWYAFSDKPWMAFWRVVLGMVTAVLVGLSFAVRPVPVDAVLRPAAVQSGISANSSCDCAAGAAGADASSIARPARLFGIATRFLRRAQSDFLRMMPILLFGAMVAATIRTSMSGAIAASTVTAHVFVATLLAMGLAFLCSLCSSSDAVIASSMAGMLPVSSMLAFLTFGPVLDLKNAMMLMAECRGRFVLRFAATFTVACLAVTMLAHAVVGNA